MRHLVVLDGSLSTEAVGASQVAPCTTPRDAGDETMTKHDHEATNEADETYAEGGDETPMTHGALALDDRPITREQKRSRRKRPRTPAASSSAR